MKAFNLRKYISFAIPIVMLIISGFITFIGGYSLKRGLANIFLMIITSVIVMLIKGGGLKKLSPSTLGQLLCIACILTLFFLSASVSELSVKRWYTMIFLCTESLLLLWTLISAYLAKRKIPWKQFVKTIVIHRYCILAIVIVGLIFCLYVYPTPRWDSEIYFYHLLNACRKFDFSWECFFSYFRLADHPSSGYAIFLAIGAFLTPCSVLGVQIVNMILLLIAVYFVYEIIQYTFIEISTFKAAAGALLVACEPMTLGLSSEINLDFGLLIFGIYLFYMHIKGYKILFLFFGVILAMTKENGILMLGGYILGYLLSRFFVEKGCFWKKLKRCTGNFLFWGGIGILFLFFIYMGITIFSGNYSAWGTPQNTGSSSITVADGSSDDLLNVFAFFNLNYVWLKLKTIFLMNFYWIFSGILVCSILYIIIKRKRIYHFLPKEYAGLYGMFGFNLLFSFSYITHNNPRYNLFSEFVLVLTGVLVLLKLMESVKKAIVLYCTITVLFLAQSYTTIDPVTLVLAKNYNTTWKGNIQLALPAWNGNKYLADTTAYNRQFVYLDKAFDKILSECDYQGEDIILYGNQRGTYFAGRSFKYEWDPERKLRVCEGGENTIPLRVIEKDFYELQQRGELSSTAIYISIPEYIGDQENEYIEELTEFYEFGEKQTVSVWGQGEISYYEIVLK